MRKPLTLIAAAAGGLAVLAALGRRRKHAELPPPPEGTDPRALELRRKLAESRTLVGEREEFEAAETPIDRAEDVEGKRRSVHERGRAVADEMRGSDTG